MSSIWEISIEYLWAHNLPRRIRLFDTSYRFKLPEDILNKSKSDSSTKLDFYALNWRLPLIGEQKLIEIGIGGLHFSEEEEGEVQILLSQLANGQYFFDVFEKNKKVHKYYPNGFSKSPFLHPELELPISHFKGEHPEYASSLDACIRNLK